ncbi:MAG: metallophosphoesterase [Candidatus Falkowbacteria bacterium]
MQVLFGIIALIIVSLILGGAHLLLFWLTSRFFDISFINRRSRVVLSLFAVVMTLISTVWCHTGSNFFSRFLYLVTWFWLGLISTAVWCLLLGWLAYLASRKYIKYHLPALGTVFWGIALILYLGAVVASFFPVVTRVNIYIAHLPYGWEGKTIVQISDAHLGAVNGPFYLNRLVNKVQKLKPDMVVITGDLVDGTRQDYPVLLSSLRGLKPPKGTYYISGNHEIYAGLMNSLAKIVPPNITVLNNQSVNIDGISLIGVGYPVTQVRGYLARILPELIVGTQPIKFLLYHSPVDVKAAQQAGISLMLAGHTHRGQLWPYNYFTWLVYGGLDKGLSTYGNFNLYTTSGSGTWGPPARLGSFSEIVEIKLLRQ